MYTEMQDMPASGADFPLTGHPSRSRMRTLKVTHVLLLALFGILSCTLLAIITVNVTKIEINTSANPTTSPVVPPVSPPKKTDSSGSDDSWDSSDDSMDDSEAHKRKSFFSIEFTTPLLPLSSDSSDDDNAYGGESAVWLGVPDRMLGRLFIVTAFFSKGDGFHFVPLVNIEDTDYNTFFFKKEMNNLYLCRPQLDLRTSDDEMRAALDHSAWHGCAETLPIKRTTGGAENPVYMVDVSSLLLGDGFLVLDLSFSASDPEIVDVAAFPENFDVQLECASSIDETGGGTEITIEVELAFTLLPERAMTSRRSDDRIGYFSFSYVDLGMHSGVGEGAEFGGVSRRLHTDEKVEVINRWRVERPKGTGEGPVEPVKPIVYHIDPSVPARWRPWLKAGVERWNVAFEKIGFKNAVRAVLPTDADWPADYHPADMRFSSISWMISLTEVYAEGLHTVDPRSGEIMGADIVISQGWNNVDLQKLEKIGVFDTHSSARSARSHLKQRDAARERSNKEARRSKNGKNTGLFATPVRKNGRFSLKFHTTDPRESSERAAINEDHILSKFMGRHDEQSHRAPCACGMHRHKQHNSHLHLLHNLHGAHAWANDTDEDTSARDTRDAQAVLLDIAPACARGGDRAECARQLEELVGMDMADTTTHEVGHTLGLRHNFKASAGVAWENLKDPQWTKDNGITASVMDYYEMNIMADGRQGIVINNRVGPYDEWAVEYGYSVLAGETVDGHEKLSEIAARGGKDNRLRYMTDEDDPSADGPDPLTNYYDLADNPIQFYKNRLAIVKAFLPSVRTRLMAHGESFKEFTNSVLTLISDVLSAASYLPKFIGGVDLSKAHAGDGRPPIQPIPASQQFDALAVLLDVLIDPAYFPSPADQPFLLSQPDGDEIDCLIGKSYCGPVVPLSIERLKEYVRGKILEKLIDPYRDLRLKMFPGDATMKRVANALSAAVLCGHRMGRWAECDKMDYLSPDCTPPQMDIAFAWAGILNSAASGGNMLAGDFGMHAQLVYYTLCNTKAEESSSDDDDKTAGENMLRWFPLCSQISS
eukprot:CAMPEP_0177638960 /NCGR_PEP_ID=MMETSP0447-20121125/5767_1 /TAXON_ID=0 /ORGANISM="Stygamoeba regulata, Strain BSH-02190019" /LENGTH=1048 /DNA_ID=CAMNT_0019140957 /DNA_START=117 /DNA_END=3263 /DNA_ORIENTATION=+